MKSFLILLCMIFGACGTSQSIITGNKSATEKIRMIAADVQQKYVPDKRTEVFEYEINESKEHLATIETTLPAASHEFQQRLREADINAKIIIKHLPSTELEGKIYGVVNLSVTNNRKEPRNAAELVTQMTLGTPVEILKKHLGYYLIRSPDRYISWVDNAALQEMDSVQFSAWRNAEKAVYTSDYGYATERPDMHSTRVSDVVNGSILQVIGKGNGFYQVLFPDQRSAFIPSTDMVSYADWADRPNPIAEQVLSTAKTMIGVPYLWGGTSIKGVDCSGFTKTSYFLNGIILARDASQQALTGIPVDIYEQDTVSVDKCLKNLLPGDLLFFTNTTDKVPHPRITHTAIYMGNGKFIQSAGMVKVNSIDSKSPIYDEYRLHTLVSARRILTAIGLPQITRIGQHPYYTTSNHE